MNCYTAYVEEIWAPIPGYEGYYEISNLGNIRSITRSVSTIDPNYGESKRRFLQKEIAQRVDTRGYAQAGLSRDGKRATRAVHQLVLEAFIGPRNGRDACHNDGNKLNNRLDNLRWDTRHNNIHDRRKDNSVKWGKKFSALEVIAIHLLRQQGLTFPVIGKLVGMSKENVRSIYHGRTWGHLYPPNFL